MKIAILASALLLAACATPQQRAQQQYAKLEAAAAVCHAAGFAPQTPEIQQCAMQIYQQNEATDAQRRATAAAIGLQLLSTPPPSRPVSCKTWSTGTVCQ